MTIGERYQLVIFDWDGTIVDSAAQIVQAMQGAIRELGLPERLDNEISELIGLGLQDAIGRLFPELQTEKVMDMLAGYRRHYGNAIEKPAPIFQGMLEVLDHLGTRGCALAVATGKSRRGLDRSLADTGLGPRFDHTRCADETANKPHPLMLHELLEESAVPARQSVMIGDTEYDMAMAKQAGIDAIGVSWGVHDVERLLAAGADAVIHTPRELLDQLVEKDGSS